MSARTKQLARLRKQYPEVAAQIGREPKVIFGENRSMEDGYSFMPKALRIYPQTVDVSVGNTGRGEALVHICEDDYEHQHFYFNLKVEGPFNGEHGHFSKVSLDGACLTLPGLDNLIEALTVARAEAAKLGLFTKRAAPKAKSA